MLIKKFNNKKETTQFKKLYSSGDIETEVISNILQPYHEDKFPETKSYINFQFNDNPLSKKMTALNFFLESYALDFLKNQFGNCDFTFDGNRTYKNYVFDFEGLTFITPSKREVVLSEGDNLNHYIPRIISFEKTFKQFLFTQMMTMEEQLPDYIKKDIIEFKKAGLISEENIINYNFFEKSKKLKP